MICLKRKRPESNVNSSFDQIEVAVVVLNRYVELNMQDDVISLHYYLQVRYEYQTIYRSSRVSYYRPIKTESRHSNNLLTMSTGQMIRVHMTKQEKHSTVEP